MSFVSSDAARRVNADIAASIRFAEVKAGALLLLGIGLGGPILTASAEVMRRPGETGLLLGTPLVTGAIAAVVPCVWHLMNAISPRSPRPEPEDGTEKYFVSVPHMAAQSPQSLELAFHALTEKDLVAHYVRHSALLSRLAASKLQSLQKGASHFYFVLFVWMALTVALKVLRL
jgi:hypothetical protein